MSLIHIEKEELAAALGRVKALIFSCALEEAGHIVYADPVSLTWRFEELLATSLIAAANNASFRHFKEAEGSWYSQIAMHCNTRSAGVPAMVESSQVVDSCGYSRGKQCLAQDVQLVQRSVRFHFDLRFRVDDES